MRTMTEDKARETWCPMYRQSSGSEETGSDNRPMSFERVESEDPIRWKPTGKMHPDCLCIASQCQLWEWAESQDWEPGEQIWEAGGGSYTTERAPKPKGYCGLRGKP